MKNKDQFNSNLTSLLGRGAVIYKISFNMSNKTTSKTLFVFISRYSTWIFRRNALYWKIKIQSVIYSLCFMFPKPFHWFTCQSSRDKKHPQVATISTAAPGLLRAVWRKNNVTRASGSSEWTTLPFQTHNTSLFWCLTHLCSPQLQQ